MLLAHGLRDQRPAMIRALPRTVLVLGGVSLLNDTASDMIAPLLPVFLTATLGAGPAVVGLVEGVAESTSSILKLISGRLADRGVPARGLVIGGYGLSNAARPLLGLAASWAAVLVLRFLDRVGKGLRSAPRDALIAGATDADGRGRAFGFHRGMDHLGAVLGPLLAFGLLAAGLDTGQVFLASSLPGVLVLGLLVFGLRREDKPAPVKPAALHWSALHRRLRAMVLAAGMLALASVPEAFMVLWAVERGLPVLWVPLVWAAASLAKSLVSFQAGVLTDRLGRLPMLIGGWSLRVAMLLVLALADLDTVGVWVAFIAYAVAVAVTEPAERALIGDHAAATERGTAFGLYHLFSGLLALPGALLFGVLWQRFGYAVALLTAALMTAAAAVGLLVTARDDSRPRRLA